jgi:hypothetical protein
MAHAGRTLDWTGGSLDELIQILSEPALSARVEARQHDGIGERAVGEVHVVAGGFSDAYSGIERGEAALAKLRKMQDLRFRVEPRLPHPVTGNLSPPGLEEGTLAERPLTELMRYCEDYVLTCTVEVWHGEQNARVSYRRGELVKTTVNGADAPEKLPEVLAWPEGHYRFALPQLALPAGPAGSSTSPASTQALGTLWQDQPSAPAPVPVPTDVAAAMPVAATPAQVASAALAAQAEAVARAEAPAKPAPVADVPASAPRGKRGGTPGPSPRSTIPFLPTDEPASPVRGTSQGMPVDVYDPPQAVRSTDVGVPAIAAPTPDTKTTLPGASHDKAAKADKAGKGGKPGKPGKADQKQDRPRAADTLHEVEPNPRSTAPGFASTTRPPASDPADEADAKAERSDKQAKQDRQDKKRKGASPVVSASPAPALSRGGAAARKPGGLYSLPLGVHVLLGLLLGALVVGGYWALQKYGVIPPGR